MPGAAARIQTADPPTAAPGIVCPLAPTQTVEIARSEFCVSLRRTMIAEQSTSPITAIRLKPEYPRRANLGLSCEFFVVRPIWRPTPCAR